MALAWGDGSFAMFAQVLPQRSSASRTISQFLRAPSLTYQIPICLHLCSLGTPTIPLIATPLVQGSLEPLRLGKGLG